LQAESGDVGAEVEEALDGRQLGIDAPGVVGTLGVSGAGHVHRQGDAPRLQFGQERLREKGITERSIPAEERRHAHDPDVDESPRLGPPIAAGGEHLEEIGSEATRPAVIGRLHP